MGFFLEVLSEYGNVHAACRASGVSRSQVYNLREREPAFAAAWDEALESNFADFEVELKQRAVKGVIDPIVYKDKVIGYRRKVSDDLLKFGLSSLNREKYGRTVDITGSIGHTVKAELPESVRGILDSLKAINRGYDTQEAVIVAPDAAPTAPSSVVTALDLPALADPDPRAEPRPPALNGENVPRGTIGQVETVAPGGQGEPCGWKVRRAELVKQGRIKDDKGEGEQGATGEGATHTKRMVKRHKI